MLRAGIHVTAFSMLIKCVVSIPMLRAGIHPNSGMRQHRHRGFNSHATRGNSRQKYIRCVIIKMVSIPMLRAGIHIHAAILSSSLIPGFNSHATRGNSHNRENILWRSCSFQFPCYAREFTQYNESEIKSLDVSIPMLRAGIHGWHLRCPFYQFFKGQLCGSVKFLN